MSRRACAWNAARVTKGGKLQGLNRKEFICKCGMWSTCICCAIFVRSMADGAGSGQGALGLVLEDGGGELLQGAAQQVGCLLGPFMTCKLFSASWDMCIKTSISPCANYRRLHWQVCDNLVPDRAGLCLWSSWGALITCSKYQWFSQCCFVFRECWSSWNDNCSIYCLENERETFD